MFGKLNGCKQNGNRIVAVFEQNEVHIEVITPSVIRFYAPITSVRRASPAIRQMKAYPGHIEVRWQDEAIILKTEHLDVRISDDFKVDIHDKAGTLLSSDYRGDGHPFTRRGAGEGIAVAADGGLRRETEKDSLKIYIRKKMERDMFFYGLGDKTGHLNKKGYHYRMWNTDEPNPHVESMEALYKSVPFLIVLRKKQAFGYLFDNTFETVFDLGKENDEYYAFGAVDGNIDYYFIYGPSVKNVIGGYTYLTRTTPLPQLRTLGYQQCRWAYAPESRLREIADTFRERDIPCDTLYLDIDYMDGYRVFTWDKKKFADPIKLLGDLKTMGYKVVTIVDPAVKKDRGYVIYDQGLKNGYFATDQDGVPYVNRVWPGDALYPDFFNSDVREWWAENQKIMTDSGVAGIWNDMNEPASFNGPLPDDVTFNCNSTPVSHREMHNVYGHYMSEATYKGLKQATGKRPFVITRACYSGTQKYATVWTGDNQSLWEHLRMSLPMLMNLGLSGFAFCGADVGGFGWDCSAELLSRWIQVGAFTPLFRNHSGAFTRDQEPWAFGRTTEEINRKYINLRYRLLPYLYDIMHEGESSGLPLLRPLLLHYQHDPATYEINDEFLCGDRILVAPVVVQGEKARLVYLPEGDSWVDYWTKDIHQGGRYIVRETPPDVCPIYIRSGSIIPLYPIQSYVGEKEITVLTLDVYPSDDRESNCRHYRDDGESFDYRNGIYNLYAFTVRKTEDMLIIKLSCEHAGYEQDYRAFRFLLNRVTPIEVLADESAVPFETSGKTATLMIGRGVSEIKVKYK